MERTLRPERLGYLSFRVRDLKISTEFFEKMGQLEVSEERDGKVFLRGGMEHHWIVLQESDNPGLERVAMQMTNNEDLDAMEERLKSHGVKYERGDGFDSDRVNQYLRFPDPAGNPLELYSDMVSYPTPPHPRHVSLEDIQHLVLFVDDIFTCHDFYTQVLGLRTSDWNERNTVFMNFRNGWHHGLGIGAGRTEKQGISHVCFLPTDLDDVMRARAAVMRAGLPITSDILRHGASGSFGFYFAGPDVPVEFSVGARRFAEDEEHTPRRLIRSPTVSDVFQVGLEELELSFEDNPDAWSDIEAVAGLRKANTKPKTYQTTEGPQKVGS
jgi:2,3-dihydroxy-p-cumate/2,3-dihydroxybenzoate 3,4-dioxygenase